MRLRRLPQQLIARVKTLRTRVRRAERREIAAFRRWIENTNNLIHLSILLFIPVLIGVVTFVSNAITELSFLLFPPLAAGTYTLFADPEGRYSSPVRFVASLTVGALCGLVAFAFTQWAYVPNDTVVVHPTSAALAILLVGSATWALDVEAPSAFSTALLTLVTGDVEPVEYVVSIFFASVVIALFFTIWRGRFYERRAEYLYETVRGDDHVLVPMRGKTGRRTAFFAARLAAAHTAGKVVLLDVLEPRATEGAQPISPDETAHEPTDAQRPDSTGNPMADAAVERLEIVAHQIQTQIGVPVEVVVARGESLPTTLETARDTNCDLVACPYEEDRGFLSDYVRGLFGGEYDTVAFRSVGEDVQWRRVLVLISRPGDTAHAMVDFATRLAGQTGSVSVTTCIATEVERRSAETKLANLVETADGHIETRVARAAVTKFLVANAATYDLVVLGSSGDRSAASRFISPPTFERIREIDCDVAVFDRGNPN